LGRAGASEPLPQAFASCLTPKRGLREVRIDNLMLAPNNAAAMEARLRQHLRTSMIGNP
jgi:hypothetical protein